MALKDFKNEMPVANAEAARLSQLTRNIQLGQQVGALTPSQIRAQGPALAQQMGGEVAAAAGDTRNAQYAQQGAVAAQSVQRDQQQAEIQRKNEELDRQKNFELTRMDQELRLENLGRDVKNEILDSVREFDTREGEIKFNNQRQVAQFMIQNAKDENEFQSYVQKVEAANQIQINMMQQAYKVFEQAERQAVQRAETTKDMESLTRIRERKAALEAAIEKSKRKSKKNGQMLAAGKIVVGAAVAVVGGIYGGPAAPYLISAGTSMAASGAQEAKS